MKFKVKNKYKYSQGIYCITNLVNGKCYIGSTKNFYTRFYTHLKTLNKEQHYNKRLQYSFLKHGAKNFEFKILELVKDNKDLFIKEQYWIDYINPEYNIALIAGEYKNRTFRKLGEGAYSKRLHINDVIGIILMLNDGFSIERTAQEYNTSYYNVEGIKLGRTFKKLSYLLQLPSEDSLDFLPEKDINKITVRISLGHSISRIAKAYNISKLLVQKIRAKYNSGEIKLDKDYSLSYTREDNCFVRC